MDELNERPVFPTTVEMFHKLRLDPKHWVNREAIRFFRRHIYEATAQRIAYYPQWLDDLEFTCQNGHQFRPAWLHKRTPLLPFFRAADGKQGLLRCYVAHSPCSQCGISSDIPLPIAKFVSEVSLFGDEAIRDIPGADGKTKLLVSYSMVNRPMQADDHEQLAAEYRALKRDLLGNDRAIEAPLHFKVLWNESGRARGIYQGVTDQQKRAFASDLGALLKRFKHSVRIYNATGIFQKPKVYGKPQESEHKAHVYTPLLLRAIEEMTKQGLAPRFFMERTGNDGWAKNLFDGGRLTLMWAYITNGLPVGTPEFVLPTTSIYLELADFVTFVVGRHVWARGQRAEGLSKPIDVDPAILGEVAYQGYEESGTCISDYGGAYPWDKFFKGTRWEGA